MAENTAVAEKKEAESRELVAKDFTEGMVVKIKQKEKFGLTFPKDYNYTNEFMSAMLILQDTVDMNKKPVLQSCTRASIENALVEMVTSGLSMQKKQCYPVAYGGKLQCQKSVYGNTCIARRYGLKDITAEVIYEGDTFEYEIVNGKKKVITHKQDFENIDNDKVKGAYAIATMDDGSVLTEVMNIKQIKQAWKQGYGYKENGNGTHQKFTDQMAMKTVKNRLLKQINNTYGSFYDGNYDSDEDIPAYDERMQADVDYEIEQNANSVDFDDADIVENVEVVDAAEVVDEQTEDSTLPPFMQAE
jgi:recombination protein RecT